MLQLTMMVTILGPARVPSSKRAGHFRFCRAMLIVFFKCGWQQGFLKTSFRPCDAPIPPRLV